MKPVAADTSVVVAALLSWHAMHRPAFRALEPLTRDGRLVLPVPVVLESFAVMTRLPSSHRLAAADAHQLLHQSFSSTPLVGFPTRELWKFLRESSEAGVSGGAAYDAAILKCAEEAGAAALLTFNRRDFERLRSATVEILVPGE